ncbi:MAG: glycosyltransferase family A protein [Bryobacteraceae bacterium]
MTFERLHDEPIVSVLMSSYNHATFLSQAIQSIVKQTYKNFEFIICDDGSDDGSVEIAKKWAAIDTRIVLIVKENGGQASGFNTAFKKCRGDVICFVDADDVYHPNKLERVVGAFFQFPLAGCVLNRLMRVDERLRTRGPLPLMGTLPTGWCSGKMLASGGILPYFPGTPGINLRREVAARLFPMPESEPLNMCPDMVMQRLVPLVTRLAAIDQPLVDIRMHCANTYMRSSLSVQSITKELKLCEELWNAQHQFLSAFQPDLGAKLRPVDVNLGIRIQRYARARLAGQTTSSVLREVLDGAGEKPRGLARTFWSMSALLPLWAFQFAANVLLTQGRAKQWLSWLEGVYRPSEHTRHERVEEARA